MAEQEQQAKQLDSVTDVVQEQEVDATKAQQAMSAFLSSSSAGGPQSVHDNQGNNNHNNNNSSNNNNNNNNNNNHHGSHPTSAAVAATVSREDVALIVNELEVTEEVAQRTLREVATDLAEGDSLVVAALRKLVTS